jgi:hypothetical protein
MTAKREAVGCIAATDRRPSGKAPTRKWLRSRAAIPPRMTGLIFNRLGVSSFGPPPRFPGVPKLRAIGVDQLVEDGFSGVLSRPNCAMSNNPYQCVQIGNSV